MATPRSAGHVSGSELRLEELFDLVEDAAFRGMFPFHRGELLEEMALLLRERRGDLHNHVHVVITASTAVEKLHAFAPHAEHLIRLRPGRHLQRLLAVDRVDLDLGAERGLGEADGMLGVNVVVAALKLRVFTHGDEHVEITGGTAVPSGLTLAGNTQARSVIDPSGNLHGNRPGLANTSRTGARR